MKPTLQLNGIRKSYRLSLRIMLISLVFLFISCQTTEQETNKLQLPLSANTSTKVESIDKELQSGDLIFHTSLSNQSMAIQIATNSKYSHVGIIYKRENDFFVYEAIQPIQFTKLSKWIKRGEKGKYVVKRLKNSKEVITDNALAKMKSEGQKYLGKDYDLRFEWSDDKIYCSELVWKIYKNALNIEIGELQRIRDFDLSDEVVKQKVKERYGDQIPMDELVITPDRMFKAENLITVIEK